MGTYTTVAEVAAILGQSVGRFNEDSLPAKEIVEKIIRSVEDYIDRYTLSAWRERRRWEDPDVGFEGYEYHRLSFKFVSNVVWSGNVVYLMRRKVRQLDPSKGDSLQVFNGRVWEEWLGVRTEGVDKDYWLNYDDGLLYLRGFYFITRPMGYVVRVKYRYGGLRVPEDIRYAASLLTACHLIESGDWTILLPEGANNIVNAVNKTSLWREKALDILERYRGMVVVD